MYRKTVISEKLRYNQIGAVNHGIKAFAFRYKAKFITQGNPHISFSIVYHFHFKKVIKPTSAYLTLPGSFRNFVLFHGLVSFLNILIHDIAKHQRMRHLNRHG